MEDAGVQIPFGNLVDYIRNKDDDEFDPYDRDDDRLRKGFALILIFITFLFVLVLLRYFCFWFIDYAIMCNHRRDNEGFIRHNLRRCFPCWFPPASSGANPENDQGRSNENDDPTAVNTIDNFNGSNSDEDGTEMVERNRSYAKRLVRILTEEQKRSIFSSILNRRTATTSDISERRREDEIQKQQQSSVDSDGEDSATTSNASLSIAVSDGSSRPNSSDGGENNHACCPICIQDIKVGNNVFHCNHCHHLFHFDCMLEWVGTGSTLCPYCRREIFTRKMLEQAYENHQSKKDPQDLV